MNNLLDYPKKDLVESLIESLLGNDIEMDYLSTGSSRIVYKVNDQVIKIAYTEAGIEQNEFEFNNDSDLIYNREKLFDYNGIKSIAILGEYVNNLEDYSDSIIEKIIDEDGNYIPDIIDGYLDSEQYLNHKIAELFMEFEFNFEEELSFSIMEMFSGQLEGVIAPCEVNLTNLGVDEFGSVKIIDAGIEDQSYFDRNNESYFRELTFQIFKERGKL